MMWPAAEPKYADSLSDEELLSCEFSLDDDLKS